MINTVLFWFAGRFVEGVTIEGFIAALIGALFVSVVSAIFDFLFGKKK